MNKAFALILLLLVVGCAHHSPGTGQSYVQGIDLIRQDRYKEAVRPLEHALEENGESAPTLYALGFTAMKLGKRKEALDYYTRCRALASDASFLAVEALIGQGVVLHDLQRYRQAVRSYDQALCLSPENTKILFNRGCALGELKEYPEAISDFRRVLSLDPGYDGADYNRLYYEHAQRSATQNKPVIQ